MFFFLFEFIMEFYVLQRGHVFVYMNILYPDGRYIRNPQIFVYIQVYCKFSEEFEQTFSRAVYLPSLLLLFLFATSSEKTETE